MYFSNTLLKKKKIFSQLSYSSRWIKEKFICKESEDKKNLQIQKSEKINDLAQLDALKKIPIPLSNIFEEIQNKKKHLTPY